MRNIKKPDVKEKARTYTFTGFEAEEILDALEERYNFLKSIIIEDEDFMSGDKTKSEDTKCSLIEMSMIHEIWEKMK